ncbi:unnamed protein product [Darwinula stevensoni]|uniref:Isochorismatase domain-containing protein 1 n=1 Tax=Darwinula stevensoni TaxID=69355 RepID=A0A7R8XDU2_9CRUS|nr:unnamed protein product [Darwinula stevensoni]CAG0889011.1 unnamed protein product [Darwinula stevensoni]
MAEGVCGERKSMRCGPRLPRHLTFHARTNASPLTDRGRNQWFHLRRRRHSLSRFLTLAFAFCIDETHADTVIQRMASFISSLHVSPTPFSSPARIECRSAFATFDNTDAIPRESHSTTCPPGHSPSPTTGFSPAFKMIPQRFDLGMLDPSFTVFFCCDFQEKFAPAILHFKEILDVSKRLVEASKMLGIPLIATEQYPKGLGKTVTELDVSSGNALGVVEKTEFSMCVEPVLAQLKQACGGSAKSIVLFGIEAHVCVEQTAIDLKSLGYDVHVVADATSSRSQEDRMLAFQRLQQIGCFITTHENVLFKLIRSKDHPKFKEVQKLIIERVPSTGLVPASKM